MKKNFLFILLFSFNSLAATKVLMPTDNLPREIIYLTESIQGLYVNDPEKISKNDSSFRELEKLFKKTNKDEMYFLAKSEVYKTSLSFKPPLVIKSYLYSKEVISQIEKKLKESNLNSFSHWLIISLLKDTQNIFENRYFPTFTNERSKGAISTTGARKIQKKFNFLLPWLQSFLEEETKLFQYSLLPLMHQIIRNITQKLHYLIAFSSRPFVKSSEINFFEDQTIEVDKSGNPFSVEDILDPLLSTLKNKNLPIPVDDWLGSDDDFATKLTPLLLQQTTKDYSPPELLPKPVSEW